MGIIAKQSIRGALANYLGVVIGAVTTFFVVTDLLTQEEIGLTRVLVDAAMLFAGLAQLGTNASILKFYPVFKDGDSHDHGFFGWTLLLPLVGFAIIASLFFLLKDNVVDYYAQNSPLIVDYVYLLLPLTFFVLYMTVFETNASVLNHIAVPKFVREVVIRVLNLAAYLLYGHRVISLDAFVWLFCSSYAVAAVVNLFYLTTLGKISFRPDWRFVDRRMLRQVIVYTLFMTAAVLAGNVKLFNSIFLAKEGLALAGIYTIACYIANVIEIPYRSLGAISGPIISTAMQGGDLAEAQRIEDEVRESGMGESAKKMTLIYSIAQSRQKKRERGLDPGEGGFSDEDIAWYNAITKDKNQREGLVSTLQKLNVAKKLRAHAAWEKLGGKNATEEDRVKLVHGDDSTDSDSYERMMNHIWMDEENDQLQNQMAANIRQYSDSLSPETRKKLDDFNEMSKEAYLSKLVDTGVADEYGDKATPYKKQLEEAQDQRYQKLYDKKYDSSKRWWQFWK